MGRENVSRRSFLYALTAAGGLIGSGVAPMGSSRQPKIRIGIIGLSVHSADFTAIINAGGEFSNCRVTVMCHPPGNADVEFSKEQLQKFTQVAKDNGVAIVSSIKEVLRDVDAVMLLTNDGRPHLEQVLPVLKAGKPVYIDKPVAENLRQVVAIYEAAKKYKTPVFSSSALRYVASAQSMATGNVIGEILGAETHGPAPIQPSHVDLFWDGIHAIELLYAVMGPGCETVARAHTPKTDVVTGIWKDQRIGVFRGLRSGRIGFGGTVYGAKGIQEIGKFDGYKGLVLEIVKFFETRTPPVTPEETIEIYAFMDAAQESKKLGGAPVSVSEVLARASKK